MAKVYFAFFERVCSLNLDDAIQYAKNMSVGHKDIRSFPSFKELKRDNRRESGVMKSGKKYVTVHHCLDWEQADWEFLLSTIDAKN